MGKIKRLELWWQLYLYVTSGSGLKKKPAITLCAFECTIVQFLGTFVKSRKATIIFVLYVRLSVRMEQLGSQRTDFYEIWHLSICRKSIQTAQVSLISDKNNGYFTWRPIYIFVQISLSSSQNEKCFRQKLCINSKHTLYVQEFFFFENRAVYEIMWKNTVQPGRPQMAIWRMLMLDI
jgi:hypothetical protein